MNGEIDFKESLRRRVALLKGTSVNVLQTVKDNLIYTEGAKSLCKALKKIGFKLAVISGKYFLFLKKEKKEKGSLTLIINQLFKNLIIFHAFAGGFIPLARHVKNELGLDYAFANQVNNN